MSFVDCLGSLKAVGELMPLFGDRFVKRSAAPIRKNGGDHARAMAAILTKH